jgi:hypothetical protein
MQTRRLGLALIALAAVAPAVSQAWPGKTPLEACVNAFEKTLVSSDEVQPKFKVVHGRDDEFMSALERYYSLGYTFDLQANDPKTGEVVAQARCLTDNRGKVSSLSPLPLLAQSQAKRVARN